MSMTMKILISAIGIGAMLATPAMAGTRVHHVVGHRAVVNHRAFGGAYAGPAYDGPNNDYSVPRTGYKYFGPYNERIVTMPNGTVLGTDPDPFIRSQMRREIGPNGVGASNPGM
jgi:hypothetical protein